MKAHAAVSKIEKRVLWSIRALAGIALLFAPAKSAAMSGAAPFQLVALVGAAALFGLPIQLPAAIYSWSGNDRLAGVIFLFLHAIAVAFALPSLVI